MKKNSKSWKYFLLRKVPVYFIFLLLGFISGVLIFVFQKRSHQSPSSAVREVLTDHPVGQLNTIQLGGFQLIRPMVLVDIAMESDEMSRLKDDVRFYIDKKKQEGIISSAAVYIRELNNESWMSINKDELFSPGSLMKIPTMISILKESEQDKGLLDKKIYFRKHFGSLPVQTISGRPLQEGAYYSVKDLLFYMIVNSDNDATALLNLNLNYSVMKKMFSDFQMPVPKQMQNDYQIDIVSCSRFLRVLYNASYLSRENSEFALGLLTQSTFKDGIIKNINSEFPVAHKFGERNVNGEQQLHEFGIFYLNQNPYLLCIMTKGGNNKLLPEVLSGISGLVFRSFSP